MTKTEIIRLAESIQGWCFKEELEWLHDRAAELPAYGTWVEVGTWKGRSLCPVLLTCPVTAKVWIVDTFAGHPNSPTCFEAQFPGWLEKHVDAIKSLAWKMRGVDSFFLKANSTFAAATDLVSNADVVYLDRDYRDCDGIRDDIKAWTKSLKPGGILCGRNHTISDASFVTFAVNELLPDHQRGPGSIWFWRKPK